MIFYSSHVVWGTEVASGFSSVLLPTGESLVSDGEKCAFDPALTHSGVAVCVFVCVSPLSLSL